MSTTTMRKYLSNSDDSDSVFKLASELFNFSLLFYYESIDEFKKYQGFVLEHNGEIQAFILYSIFECECERPIVYIEFIASKQRGLGYGQMLLTHFLNHFDNLGMSSYLHIETFNDDYVSRLESWYKVNGFVESPLILFPLCDSMSSSVKTMTRLIKKN